MKKRINEKPIRFFLLWAAILLLTLGGIVVATQQNFASDKKERTMQVVSETIVEPRSVPPIDEMVPANLETASFGLG